MRTISQEFGGDRRRFSLVDHSCGVLRLGIAMLGGLLDLARCLLVACVFDVRVSWRVTWSFVFVIHDAHVDSRTWP